MWLHVDSLSITTINQNTASPTALKPHFRGEMMIMMVIMMIMIDDDELFLQNG